MSLLRSYRQACCSFSPAAATAAAWPSSHCASPTPAHHARYQLPAVPLRFASSTTTRASGNKPTKAVVKKATKKMPYRSKLQRSAADLATDLQHQTYPLTTALRFVNACSRLTFDESINISINTGLDPRKPNQSLRGVCSLPNGTGKKVRVAVFAKGAKAEEARAAGAEIVGEADLAQNITSGQIDFDRCIATPDMMAVVGRVARILGPRGLMPNPKLGTVTMDLKTAIKNAKAGQVQYKSDRFGIIHAAIGKVSFPSEAIQQNITEFVDAIVKAKPSGAKGQYIKSIYLTSTLGPAVPVDIDTFKQAPPTSSRQQMGNTPGMTVVVETQKQQAAVA